ncbi:MAG: RNA polymerase sigma factor [Phycisphaerales bacterium]|nr:RNA polymerase sigma factor [Phycisphaerales bacterium]
MMHAVEVEFDADHPLMEAIQQRDSHAMAELIQRHGRWVRGVIFAVIGRTDEVDDIAQKVWIRVWNQAGGLEDVTRWRSWLYRVARNTATDAIRGRQRRRRLLGRFFDYRGQGRQHAPAAEQSILADERQQAVIDAIAALPALYREPFVLKHLEEWSYKQIGQALDLPVDTVETRLVRARRLLRERLAGKV